METESVAAAGRAWNVRAVDIRPDIAASLRDSIDTWSKNLKEEEPVAAERRPSPRTEQWSGARSSSLRGRQDVIRACSLSVASLKVGPGEVSIETILGAAGQTGWNRVLLLAVLVLQEGRRGVCWTKPRCPDGFVKTRECEQRCRTFSIATRLKPAPDERFRFSLSSVINSSRPATS